MEALLNFSNCSKGQASSSTATNPGASYCTGENTPDTGTTTKWATQTKEEPPVDVPPQPLTEPCAVISMTRQQV